MNYLVRLVQGLPGLPIEVSVYHSNVLQKLKSHLKTARSDVENTHLEIRWVPAAMAYMMQNNAEAADYTDSIEFLRDQLELGGFTRTNLGVIFTL